MSRSNRPTPWALIFEAPFFLEEHCPRIAHEEEAREESGPLVDAAALLALPAGRTLLGAVVPDDVRGPAAAPGRSPTAASAFVVDRYAALLFAAYRYWRGNGTEHAFDEATVRALLETGTAPAGPVLDHVPPTGYAVLPRNLVWSRVEEDAPAEPLDGFFWVYSDTGAPQLAIVAALGVRADRGGFSVLDAAAPLPADGHFAADAPPEGEFDNFLPGGELQKLFGVRTSEALMRLASLLLWQLAQRPERDG
jgi:hypothetical protein